MAVTDWKTAGTGADVPITFGKIWQNEANITAEDGDEATCNMNLQRSFYLTATNFGFTASDVPNDATVTGIEFRIKARSNNGIAFFDRVRLIDSSGTILDTDLSDAQQLTSTLTDYDYGGEEQLWGDSPTPADIQNSASGVAVAFVTPLFDFVGVDVIEQRVHYTPAEGEEPDPEPDTDTEAPGRKVTLLPLVRKVTVL